MGVRCSRSPVVLVVGWDVVGDAAPAASTGGAL